MSKPFTYWVRLAMVATMCTLVTFSPVSAGRWMDRLLHRDACKVVPDCCEPKVTCEPVVSCDPGCLVVPVAPCAQAAPTCCDSMPMEPVMNVSPKAIAPAVVPSSPVIEKPAPVIEKPAPVIVKPAPVIVKPAPEIEKPAPVIVKPAPVVEKPAPVIEKPAPVIEKPAPVIDKPSDSNPFSEPAVKEPLPVAPIENDPFGAEPEVAKPAEPDMPAEPAAKSDLDDLFGDKPAATEPAATEPAATEPEVPAEVKPTEPGLDDLFGSETKPTTPASDAPVEAKPADESIDDLFGSEPKADLPAPATTPAQEPGLDDLFGPEPKPVANGTPAKPAAEPSFDDLFDSQPAATPVPAPADASIDDLFGKPIATETQSAPTAATTSDDGFIDSLFGKPTTKPESATTEPAATKAIEQSSDKPAVENTKEPVDELDALFGLGANTRSTDFNGAEFRQWVDNSGAYQVKARLAVIYSDKVKLMKENGKFTTVPLSRLSEADFGYVNWVASSLTKPATSRMVKSETPPVESDVAR